MGKTREIKKRIKAVGNIRRITKTMQMIATSKFARAQQRATATKPYTEGVFELVRQIAAASSASHPLLTGPTEKPRFEPKPLTLIITSDRGLCGPYNGSVLRTAMAFLRENPAAKAGVIELVGKKGAGFMRFAGIEPSEQHQFGDKVGLETIEGLAQSYMDRFIAGEVSVVNVIYMRFISAGRQRPEIMQLLPLKPTKREATPGDSDAAAGASVEYEFSPRAEQLLGSLLPAAVKSTLLQAFNDAIVSEHVARMVAMKAATDNAGKMGKRLTRQFNRARQSQITTELTEIISGAAALN
ncbi:MAG: ATP synthase F1 subunit gamma [Phycisphaeraceae bacterium]|nr:ATP synthase F1 subunit gamma [Phycisphaeraceae bacterium]